MAPPPAVGCRGTVSPRCVVLARRLAISTGQKRELNLQVAAKEELSRRKAGVICAALARPTKSGLCLLQLLRVKEKETAGEGRRFAARSRAGNTEEEDGGEVLLGHISQYRGAVCGETVALFD
ncbi:rab1 small GTP-binding protein [Trypanosoma rangeli]|uniref:Rab1 small GTP-binding protein n=1 Tax=Trypanosoma rangeli TaxID=5698 RepID=A0A422P5A7_TRYRA|nr:rab1 small GTP-binding protein [Trypanosoma rangeli]RNF12913.1 rab1 small GTP-binding protein [Trypanosoma rangeli]|eukprot:RNF12913.1 rab1 small GTP-binding protein [Trypanosoma rangeli]